jgi:hypothetical protein
VKYTLSPRISQPKINIKTVPKYVKGKNLDIAKLFIDSILVIFKAAKISPFEKQ